MICNCFAWCKLIAERVFLMMRDVRAVFVLPLLIGVTIQHISHVLIFKAVLFCGISSSPSSSSSSSASSYSSPCPAFAVVVLGHETRRGAGPPRTLCPTCLIKCETVYGVGVMESHIGASAGTAWRRWCARGHWGVRSRISPAGHHLWTTITSTILIRDDQKYYPACCLKSIVVVFGCALFNFEMCVAGKFRPPLLDACVFV